MGQIIRIVEVIQAVDFSKINLLYHFKMVQKLLRNRNLANFNLNK